MNEVHTLMTLLTVHFIALMSPGPDFALVVQNAGRYGRQVGVTIALGLSLGILLHSILSLTGTSLLIREQPTLFALLQGAGGAYLLWLGLGAARGAWASLRQTNAPSADHAPEPVAAIGTIKQALAKGFATNILNPKALVFFLSLLSTLIPAGMSTSGKITAISLLWLISFLWFALLAWLLTGQRVQQTVRRWTPYVDALCGLIFLVIGTTILVRLLPL